MPSLHQLIEEIRKRQLDPDEVLISGTVFDAIVESAEDDADEEEG